MRRVNKQTLYGIIMYSYHANSNSLVKFWSGCLGVTVNVARLVLNVTAGDSACISHPLLGVWTILKMTNYTFQYSETTTRRKYRRNLLFPNISQLHSICYYKDMYIDFKSKSIPTMTVLNWIQRQKKENRIIYYLHFVIHNINESCSRNK